MSKSNGASERMVPPPKPFQLFILAVLVVGLLVFIAFEAGVRLPSLPPPSPPRVYDCPNGDWNGTKSQMTEKSFMKLDYIWVPDGDGGGHMQYYWTTDYRYYCPVCGKELIH